MAECPKKGKAQSAHAADEAAEVAFVTVEDEAHHACVQEPRALASSGRIPSRAPWWTNAMGSSILEQQLPWEAWKHWRR